MTTFREAGYPLPTAELVFQSVPLPPWVVPFDNGIDVWAARKRGRTAADAATLVGWSRAKLYRHQAGVSAHEDKAK